MWKCLVSSVSSFFFFRASPQQANSLGISSLVLLSMSGHHLNVLWLCAPHNIVTLAFMHCNFVFFNRVSYQRAEEPESLDTDTTEVL